MCDAVCALSHRTPLKVLQSCLVLDLVKTFAATLTNIFLHNGSCEPKQEVLKSFYILKCSQYNVEGTRHVELGLFMKVLMDSEGVALISSYQIKLSQEDQDLKQKETLRFLYP